MVMEGIHHSCSLLAGARTRRPEARGDVCVPCFFHLITSWTSNWESLKFLPHHKMKCQEHQVCNLTIIMKPVSVALFK